MSKPSKESVPPSEYRDPAAQWLNDLKVLFYRGPQQAQRSIPSLPSRSSWLELVTLTKAGNWVAVSPSPDEVAIARQPLV
jgi:hypothetical protein